MTYELTLRNKYLCTETKTFDEFIEALEHHVAFLKEMRAAGVKLEDNGGIGDDYATFTTEDAELAERFGMEELNMEEFDMEEPTTTH
jgi:hypothetical protein